MLIGKYKYSTDSKNRICIPHKFRGDLGGKCIISKDMLDNCLNLYSLEQWSVFSKKIEELPTIKMRRVRQLVYSNSDDVELDSQGRIVLSQELCKNTGLLTEKEVMIVGTLTHVQIWSLSEWEKFDGELNSEESKESVVNDLLEIGF